jgi:hypothetical protein
VHPARTAAKPAKLMGIRGHDLAAHAGRSHGRGVRHRLGQTMPKEAFMYALPYEALYTIRCAATLPWHVPPLCFRPGDQKAHGPRHEKRGHARHHLPPRQRLEPFRRQGGKCMDTSMGLTPLEACRWARAAAATIPQLFHISWAERE